MILPANFKPLYSYFQPILNHYISDIATQFWLCVLYLNIIPSFFPSTFYNVVFMNTIIDMLFKYLIKYIDSFNHLNPIKAKHACSKHKAKLRLPK